MVVWQQELVSTSVLATKLDLSFNKRKPPGFLLLFLGSLYEMFLRFYFLLLIAPPFVSIESHAQVSDSTSISHDTSIVVLRFGGDVLLAGHYEDAASDTADLAFENFDILHSADIAMVNLESPVTTRGTKIEKPFNFRTHPRFLNVLTSAGIDIVSLANNHIYDYDSLGLFDTIRDLDSVGILHVGAGRDRSEAHRPVVLKRKGRKIGFLSYYGGSEAPVASQRTPGVAEREIGGIIRDVRSLRARDSADFVIVNLHWGTEKAEQPEGNQVAFAHKLIDAGVDAVIGHHPHVLQGVELYKSGVIVYSLGNLIFGGNSRSSYDTGVFEIRLGTASIEYELIPVRVTNWNASLLQGAEADSLIKHVSDLSRIFPKSIFNLKEKQ